jgi:hypothetical protein
MLMSEILMIIAIVVSPIIAIQVENYRERICADKQRRLEIFRTLMATRSIRLDPRHIEALNMIELDFHKSKEVKEKWKEYFTHLYKQNPHPEGTEKHETMKAEWLEKSSDLLSQLLHVMGKSLGYNFNEMKIKYSSYCPEGSIEKEKDLLVLRQQLARIVKGEIPLPVIIYGKPSSDEDLHHQKNEQHE